MKPPKIIFLAFCVAVALCLGIVAVVLLAGRPSESLPNPNGYDDFVKAAGLLAYTNQLSVPTKKMDLRELVRSNRNALDLVRTGLGNQCRVPAYFTNYYDQGWSSVLNQFENLAAILEAEGRLAESEARTNDAITNYLEIVRFGQECSRGGFMFNHITGLRIEGMGVTNLTRLGPALDARQCRAVLDGLAWAEEHREPMSETRAREKAAIRSHLSVIVQIKLFGMIAPLAQGGFSRGTALVQKQSRQLALSLAARACTLDHGAAPKSADDLVPAYLKAVPVDPVTGNNMVLPP
jgi:hypothetical protein